MINSTKTRKLHKLPANILKSAKPGFHGDGGNLWLIVDPSGAMKWEFRFSSHGRVRHKGLGARDVSLAKAREKAAECRSLLAKGIDPIDAGKAAAPCKTFAACALDLIQSKESGWRSDKHAKQWGATIFQHCRSLLATPVDQIDTAAVLGVLKPIWQKIPETASRVRGRIEAVLDYAKASGLRSGENPAAWRGHLALILPARQKLSRGHHAAMPYGEVPAFRAVLREQVGLAARALEFLIFTAARSGEVLGARWAEIDLDAKVWTVPAARMKTGREHRVPLSEPALAILETLATARTGEFIFAGQKAGKPLSGMAMEMVMRRMKIEDATVHGFRSSFRDWCGNETTFPRELAEAALAHATGDATERAYRRSDALERRRVLMEAWGAYIAGDAPGNVVPMRRTN